MSKHRDQFVIKQTGKDEASVKIEGGKVDLICMLVGCMLANQGMAALMIEAVRVYKKAKKSAYEQSKKEVS